MEELSKMARYKKYRKANSLPDWQQYHCMDFYKSLGKKGPEKCQTILSESKKNGK